MKNEELIKGMAIGIAAGAVIGMLISPKKKRCGGIMGRMLKTAGNVIENLSDTLEM